MSANFEKRLRPADATLVLVEDLEGRRQHKPRWDPFGGGLLEGRISQQRLQKTDIEPEKGPFQEEGNL